MSSINDVERRLALLESNLLAAREVFYWRSESFSGIEELVNEMFNRTFPEDSEAIHTELSQCRKRAKISALLDRVIVAEEKCTMLEVRWQLLEELRMQKLVHTDETGIYQLVRRVRGGLVELVQRNDPLPSKVTALTLEWKAINGRIVENDLITKKMLSQAKELLQLFQWALASMKDQVERYVAPPNPENSPYVATKGGLKQELDALDPGIVASYQALAEQIPEPFLNKVHFTQPLQAVDSLLEGYKTCSHEYAPWRLFGWTSGTYWSSWLVNPGQVAARIRALSETAGCQITGLLADLTVAEVQGSFVVYERAIQKVQATVDDARDKMVEVVGDKDFDKLASYVNGCDMALEELRRLLSLAQDRGLSFSNAVFRTASLLKPFLEAKKVSFDLASRFFDVAEARNIYKTQELERPQAGTWMAISLARIEETVEKIFNRYFNRYSEPTPQEKDVWNAFMQDQLEEPFTTDFQTLVIKSAMRVLYANQRYEIDSKLELLIWKAERHANFEQAKDDFPAFKKAVIEYDAYYKAFRFDPLLEKAHELIQSIFKLQDDHLDYTKVVAACVEFAEWPLDPRDKAYEKYKERLSSLSQLLFSLLNTYAKERDLPLICPTFYESPIRDFLQSETLDKMLIQAALKEGILYAAIDPQARPTLIFESFIRRVAACVLYGKDRDDKQAADEVLKNLFGKWSRKYSPYIAAFSESTKSLIRRYTMIKFHREEKIEDAEWQYLLEGEIHKQRTPLEKLTLLEIIVRDPKGGFAREYSEALAQELLCYSLYRVEAGRKEHSSIDPDRYPAYLNLDEKE